VPLPLTGITVLALEHAVAGPFCTRQLADHGARVIKVERPGVGDFARSYDTRVRGLSSYFVWANRSKESLSINLKHPEAPELLRRILGGVDVLVQNLAPGAAERLGLSFDALADSLPRLIVCDISGYGDDPRRPGPYRDRKAYDLLIQGEAGFISITGSPEAPAKAGCSIADIAAGMYAYSNILLALIERGRTGRGKRIDLSMLESLVEWMGYPLYYAFDGASPPARAGADHATIYPYGSFVTGDGDTVILAVQNDREWQLFCTQILGLPALVGDTRFVTNTARNIARETLHHIIVEALAALSTKEVVHVLEKAGIAHGQINNMAQVRDHPQLRARGRWIEIETPVGPVQATLPPGASDVGDVRMDPVPAVGQHNESLLREFGFDPNEIIELARRGAL
jgi:itaconate CoA-transferase